MQELSAFAVRFRVRQRIGLGLQSQTVADEQVLAVGRDGQRSGIPTGWNEAFHLAAVAFADVDVRNAVIVRIGNEQCLTVRRDCERIGRAAFRGARE